MAKDYLVYYQIFALVTKRCHYELNCLFGQQLEMHQGMYGRVHIHAPLNTTRTWTRVEQVCSTRFVSRLKIAHGGGHFSSALARTNLCALKKQQSRTHIPIPYAHFLLTTFIRLFRRWNHPLPVYACALAREHIPIQTAFG